MPEAQHFAVTERHTDTWEILRSLALAQDDVMG